MVKVRVYTTRWCGYCIAAKRFLDRRGVAYEEIDVSRSPAMRQWLLEVTGRRTVPQIFIGDRSIGGYTDLVALERANELEPLLEGAD